MTRRSITIVLLAIFVASFTGCSDESDGAPPDAGDDVGEATGDEMPSVDSIDSERVELADQRRIHVIEAADRAGVIPENPDLDATDYFGVDLAARLTDTSELVALPITGQDSSTIHNSVRYIPEDATGDRFGVGLQVWDLQHSETTPDDRLAELQDQFTGVSEPDDSNAPEGSFLSERTGIKNFVFTASSAPYLFILSCDTGYCDEPTALVELGDELADEY